MLLFLVKDAHAVSISVEGISWVGRIFQQSPKTWLNYPKLLELNETGHLAYLSEASALHNSLLLHDDTDAVTFMFEPSMHTDRVQVMVEHPLLPDSTWEDGFRTSKQISDSAFWIQKDGNLETE